MSLLDIRDLKVNYGYIKALKGISLKVEKGEILAIIGSNGAGKSTLLKTIIGLIRPVEGTITYQGQEIQGVGTPILVRKGMVILMEGRAMLTNMTVYENMLMGAYIRRDAEAIKKDALDIMKQFPVLEERIGQKAGSLSGGEQQMLAIARALMAKPQIILMDEPSLGLAPKMVAQVFKIILDLHKMGITVLLVEQNARQALRIAQRAYLMETGKIVLSGSANDLINNLSVQEAYLGGKVS